MIQVAMLNLPSRKIKPQVAISANQTHLQRTLAFCIKPAFKISHRLLFYFFACYVELIYNTYGRYVEILFVFLYLFFLNLVRSLSYVAKKENKSQALSQREFIGANLRTN